MFKVGPNPYGMCFTLGIQGQASHPRDAQWFVTIAEEMGARCIEFHLPHLLRESPEGIDRIAGRLLDSNIEAVLGAPSPLIRFVEVLPLAKQLGVRSIRSHLTPVLCGARAEKGSEWGKIVSQVRSDLREVGPIAADNGLVLGIENHQDFGSDELLELCEVGGPGIGITLDTGNPLAVAEDPLEFARKVAHKVCHIHLKDYRAQPTLEGYRLVRCAIGDGAVPFLQIQEIMADHHSELTASLEPGALAARHVKLLTPEWWDGYPPRTEEQKRASLPAAKVRAMEPEDDWMTPWEWGKAADEVCAFEMEQMERSVKNMKSMGWLPA